MPEHSPLPWQVGHEEHGYKRPCVADANWQPIAILHSEADASLIVRAVNSHAELVRALEIMYDPTTRYGTPVDALAILAKAKGDA